MDSFIKFIQAYSDYVWEYFGALANPGHRLFFVFLLTSLMFAYGVFRFTRKKQESKEESFLSFLFPRSVWSNPAAWLDVRYFFFHGLIGHFFLASLGVTALITGIHIGAGFVDVSEIGTTSPYGPVMTTVIMVAAFCIITLIADFMAFYLHYLQHKIPLLWQFHKVHHAGEVMHPLSNFREHPVDNFVYKLVISLASGVAWGVILRLVGDIPSDVTRFGLSAIMLVFNLGGYHLRHSHIWLKWPGRWSKIFASPAHHHIHHSRHPDHLDKNFAFIFPFWDVLFGCYHMPEDNRDVEFGIVEDASELNSCINLYCIPFRDAYRILKKPKPETFTDTVSSET